MSSTPAAIYIVEDEALIAMELADRLTSMGFAVCGQAARGEQALEEIPLRRPDLVLMDIKLAGALTGIETASRLRERIDVPVVFLSAFSDNKQVEEAVGAGSFGYLVKPFEERELHATIQAARYKHKVEQLLRQDNDRLEAIVQERSAALWESEAQLRDIFDGTSDLIQSVDAAGRLLLVNRAWRETLGYSPEEVATMSFLDAIAPEERAHAEALFRRMLAGEDIGLIDVTFRRRGGGDVVVEGRINVRVVKGEVVGARGIFRDVTERKAAEAEVRRLNAGLEVLVRQRTQKLAESEERFKLVNRATFDVIWDQDIATGTVWWNEHFEAIYGYRPDEIAGKNGDFWRACLHPEDRVRVIAHVEATLRAPVELWSDRYRFRRKDGSYAFVEDRAHIVRDAEGRPLRLLGAMQDRTEQMAAEAALRESEERFRTAFDASPIPILISAVPDGNIIEVNAAALQTFGYTRDEVLGRSTAELGIWTRPEQRAEFFRTIARERTVHGFEAGMRAKSGAQRTMLCTGTVLMLGDRQCALTSAVDITAARQAETEKTQLQARLYQNQKYEALGTLAGGVAHDFNNILTGIINFTMMARDDCLPAEAEARKYLDDVLSCSNRAKDLVRQILLFSRSQNAERVPLLLQDVVQEALSLLRSTLPAAVEIRSDIDRQAPAVLANATQIHQALMNLAINAAHAMEAKGGILTVHVRSREVDAALAAELGDVQPGRHVSLEVTDTGAGMEPAVVARIFEPFFTTKRVGEGTGLGLAVVHSVVRSHKGAIRVHSRPGQGTTFDLFFPLHVMRAPARKSATARELPLGRGQRILLVEDDATVSRSVQMMLDRLGYRVTAFTHPENAIARFSESPGEFDALITDFQLPGMDGMELARKFLAWRPAMPVFVTSGFSGGVTGDQMLNEGVTAFFSKPFDLRELADTLAQHLRPPGGA